MIRHLLDTNIVSEPLKPVPSESVRTRLRAHADSIAIASVVWHELVYGAHRMPAGRKRRHVERYLADVIAPTIPVVSFDDQATEWLAGERARLEALGKPRPFADGIIAATAAAHGLILVTRNTHDFEGYRGLHVENWFEFA